MYTEYSVLILRVKYQYFHILGKKVVNFKENQLNVGNKKEKITIVVVTKQM